jgi:hypothetical protein
MDGPGIELRRERDFPPPSRPVLRPAQPHKHQVPGLSWGVKRSGRCVNHPPHLVPRLKKESFDGTQCELPIASFFIAWSKSPSLSRFHGHRHTTLGRIPLDKWSAPHREIYLTTHNTQNIKHTYIHTHIHIYILTYIHSHTYIHTHIRTYVRTYVHTYIHTYISSFGGLAVSMLVSGTQDRGFAPGRSRRIFRAKKSSASLPSEGK